MTTANPEDSPTRTSDIRSLDVEWGAFLESVLNASNDCIKVLSLAGELIFMNAGGMEIMEIDDFDAVKGLPWPGFWKGEYHPAALLALDRARAGETGHFVGLAETYRKTPKWWDVTVTPIYGWSSETPTHLLSISRDISVARTAELQREMLSGELNHRIKNLLSVVGSIAVQTFNQADQKSVAAFTARLSALGEAQVLLIANALLSAPMEEVIARSLLPHAPEGRTFITGPALELSPKRALALALAIHELATNAEKYGAFSNALGVVQVSWAIQADQLTFRWAEKGGPPIEPPTRKGFGTRLITRNLAGEFRGKIDVQHPSTGIVLTLTAPL